MMFMSEYVKNKRRLYEELAEIKAKYVELCEMIESMEKVYQANKPESKDGEEHD